MVCLVGPLDCSVPVVGPESGERSCELSSACGEKSREVRLRLADGREDGRGGCGVQTAANTPGPVFRPYRFSSPACPLVLSSPIFVSSEFVPKSSRAARADPTPAWRTSPASSRKQSRWRNSRAEARVLRSTLRLSLYIESHWQACCSALLHARCRGRATWPSGDHVRNPALRLRILFKLRSRTPSLGPATLASESATASAASLSATQCQWPGLWLCQAEQCVWPVACRL
jgi:hypothetical protein